MLPHLRPRFCWVLLCVRGAHVGEEGEGGGWVPCTGQRQGAVHVADMSACAHTLIAALLVIAFHLCLGCAVLCHAAPY